MANEQDFYNKTFGRNGARGVSHSPRIIDGRPADLQPLKWIVPADWDGKPVPERKWIVADLIPEGNVTLLAGDGGIGKSLLALQLLSACALGKPWLGRGCRPCKAVGVFCEDDRDELQIRLGPILDHYGSSMGDLDDLQIMSRVGEDSLLIYHGDQWSMGDESPLWTRLQNDVLDFGAELVVLDSLHDFFGGNENSRPQARQFVGMLRSLAVRIKGAVVLTSHPSMSGRATGTGEAGSTAWNNAVRARLYLTSPKVDEGQEPEPNARVLTNKKANYSKRGGEIRLQWRDGVFVSDEPDSGMLGVIERQSCESLFIQLVKRTEKEGRRVSASPRAANFAPAQFARRPDRENFRERDFRRAMETLFATGKLHTVETGPPSRRYAHISVVEGLL